MGAADPRPTPRRLPSLDGWRALSIGLVLCSHYRLSPGFPAAWAPGAEWLGDGSLGVRVFFVLSGLLITGLLLEERAARGGISLRRFYARRALRILPVYFAYLAVVGLLQAGTAYHQSAATWLAQLTLTSDFFVSGQWTTGHLWSLAVEEQFYLLWPLLLAGLYRRPRLLGLFLAVTLTIPPIARTLSYLKLETGLAADFTNLYSFFANFDALALGCTGAFLIARPDRLDRWLLARPRTVQAGALGLVLVPIWCTHRLVLGFVTVPFGFTSEDAGILILVLQSVRRPDLSFYSLLNAPPLVRIGILSYSIYIWQQLFRTPAADFGWPPFWWLRFPGGLLASAAAALASYYGLERPFLRLRARLRPPGAAVAPA